MAQMREYEIVFKNGEPGELQEEVHAKNQFIWRSGSMVSKIMKLHINGVTQIVTPQFKKSYQIENR